MREGLVVLDAGLGEAARDVDELLPLGVVLGGGVDRGEVRVVVVDAVDRWVALTSAARVPRDDVEPAEDLLVVDAGGTEREERAFAAGATRVHEQRADLVVLVLRVVASEEQLEPGPVGIGPVDGDLERGDVDGIVERLPLERARVERLHVDVATRRRPRLADRRRRLAGRGHCGRGGRRLGRRPGHVVDPRRARRRSERQTDDDEEGEPPTHGRQGTRQKRP